MDLVVFGPRTRLAAAVVAAAQGRGITPVVVARSPEEQQWCRATYADISVLPGWTHASPFPTQEALGIALCAFGPIHPGRLDFGRDSAAVSRDLASLGRVLQATERARVVFVSSALAPWPRRARAYYAGFKGVMLAAVEGLVADARQATLSVLFPGRLVEKRSWGRPLSFLHTSYSVLAERVLRLMRPGPEHRTLVGADARLLVATRTVRAFASAVTGKGDS